MQVRLATCRTSGAAFMIECWWCAIMASWTPPAVQRARNNADETVRQQSAQLGVAAHGYRSANANRFPPGYLARRCQARPAMADVRDISASSPCCVPGKVATFNSSRRA
jgi:hypothetical protein